MQRPTLMISFDADDDWLTAIEFGRVDDGVVPGCWDPISCRAAWLLDEPGGRPIGVRVNELSTADLGDPDLPGGDFDDFADPAGPRFDAPTRGLTDVTILSILIAAYAFYKGKASSLNRFYFTEATGLPPAEAIPLWNLCLETGDQMAHYGLGCCHAQLGHHRTAYAHLRHYVTLAPFDAWTWCWLGRAALGMGEVDEARAALERAVQLEEETGTETEARELLERVG